MGGGHTDRDFASDCRVSKGGAVQQKAAKRGEDGHHLPIQRSH